MCSPARTSLFPLSALALLAMALWSCSSTASPAPSPSPTTAAPVATRTPVSTHQWILIDLPPGATQVQYGAEVYRLVCRDCHGDRGQGLTAEWRATWAPADQNCWQAKCHGESHPQDGFKLPVAPPIVGKPAISQFATANDLYEFIQNEMPWQNPGSLTERDAWGVTTYVLTMNQIDPGPVLDAGTALQIRLR